MCVCTEHELCLAHPEACLHHAGCSGVSVLSHPMGRIRRCSGRVGVGVNCSWGPTHPPLVPTDIKNGE